MLSTVYSLVYYFLKKSEIHPKNIPLGNLKNHVATHL